MQLLAMVVVLVEYTVLLVVVVLVVKDAGVMVMRQS